MKRSANRRKRLSPIRALVAGAVVLVLAAVGSLSGPLHAQSEDREAGADRAPLSGGETGAVADGSLLRLVDSNSLYLLSQSAALVENRTGQKVDFESAAAIQRVIEVLQGYHSSQGSQLPFVGTPEFNNVAVSLATDLAYILSGPQARDMSAQKEQYMELLQIAEREFERILGEYAFDVDAEAGARKIFEQNAQACLSFFSQPRLAALSEPRLANEMATLKVDVARSAQVQGREFMEKPFEWIINDPNTASENRQKVLGMSIRSTASFLGSMPFQIYVAYGTNLGRASTNADLGRLATIGGINVSRTQYDDSPVLVVEYYYRPEEVALVTQELAPASKQP